MERKTIHEWQTEIHRLAKTKGWYEGRERAPLEFHMLFVSEVAEATEAVRENKPALYYCEPEGSVFIHDSGVQTDTSGRVMLSRELPSGTQIMAKPEGEAVELADVVIRIMDYFGHRGWDLEQVIQDKHEYNKTRPYRHGGKIV